MKTRTIFYLMMLVSVISTTSCESYLNEQPEVVIEPDDVPMFQFGEDGIPYRWHTPTLSADMQRDLQKEFVGYGWKWMQTNEILASGLVLPKEYYETMIGASPKSYYIESATELVTFFYSDATPAYLFSRDDYQMDVKTGLMTSEKLSSYGMPWNVYMRVWTIYKLSGRWYMSCLQPLCTRTSDSQEKRLVWATSQYVRMTDDELKQMKAKHNFE